MRPELKRSEADPDARAVAALLDVGGAFRNPTNWYNNASFLLPLVASILVALAAALTRRADLAGFAGFLAAVTLVMLPVVLASWRQTATLVVLTRSGIVSFHHGQVLKSLDWPAVTGIQPRDTQGNLRWEIAGSNGDRLLLDSELEDLPELLRLARKLSGAGREREV